MRSESIRQPAASGPAPPTTEGERIDIREMSAVEYWAHRFGVCKAALLKAIDEVGPAVAEVRRHLGR